MANVHWFINSQGLQEFYYSTFARPQSSSPSMPYAFNVSFEDKVKFRATYYNVYDATPVGAEAGLIGDGAYSFNGSTVKWITEIPKTIKNLYRAFSNSKIEEIKSGEIPNSVINVKGCFAEAPYFNQSLKFGNKITSLEETFRKATAFNSIIINQQPITKLSNTFYGAREYNQPVTFIKDAEYVYLDNAFAFATNFNQSVKGKKLINGSHTFENASLFNSVVEFDEITGNMPYMFKECYCFNQPTNFLKNTNNSDTSGRDLQGIFFNCINYNQETFVPRAKFLGQAFQNCEKLNQIITFDNKFYGKECQITNMERFLLGAKNFNQFIKIPDGTTNLFQSFGYCKKLNQPVIINKLSPIIDMSGCFIECSNLTYPINIPHTIANLHAAFAGCNNLTKLGSSLIEGESGLRDLSQAFISTGISDPNVVQVSAKMPLENVYQALAYTNVFSPSYFHLRYPYQNDSLPEEWENRGLYETFAYGRLDNIYKVDEAITYLPRTFYGARHYPKNGFISIPGTVKTLQGTFADIIDGEYYMEGNIRKYNVYPLTIQLEEGVETILDESFVSSPGLSVSVPNSIIKVYKGSFSGVKRVCYEGSLSTKEWGDESTSIGKHNWGTEIYERPSYCYEAGGTYVVCKECGGHKWINRNDDYAEHDFINGYCFYCGRPEHLEDYFIYIIGLLDDNGQVVRNSDNSIYEAQDSDPKERKRAFILDIYYDKWDKDFGSMSIIDFPRDLNGYKTIVL